MKKLVFLLIAILAGGNFAFAQMPFGLEKVKEIKLLKSNRDDVRKTLAGFKHTYQVSLYQDVFSTENSEIWVEYSGVQCKDDSEGWNIPEWKAMTITVSLENSIKFKDAEPILSLLGTRLTKLKKEKVYNNRDNYYLYHDKDLGIALNVNGGEIVSISFQPSRNYYSLLCNKKAAKRLSSTSSWFAAPLKDRVVVCGLRNDSPDIDNLILSLPEIMASCPSPANSAQNKSCSDGVKVIAVFAVSKDPEGDVLTYSYQVSDGKITGQGEKVLWDLTGVAPGTYTITAAVDDGCGFCGMPMTKTVVVKECGDCRKK